jgi:hypothetical protein
MQQYESIYNIPFCNGQALRRTSIYPTGAVSWGPPSSSPTRRKANRRIAGERERLQCFDQPAWSHRNCSSMACLSSCMRSSGSTNVLISDLICAISSANALIRFCISVLVGLAVPVSQNARPLSNMYASGTPWLQCIIHAHA